MLSSLLAIMSSWLPYILLTLSLQSKLSHPIVCNNSCAGTLFIHLVYHQNIISTTNQKIVVFTKVRIEIIGIKIEI